MFRVLSAIESYIQTLNVSQEGAEHQANSKNVVLAVVCPSSAAGLHVSTQGNSAVTSVKNVSFVFQRRVDSTQSEITFTFPDSAFSPGETSNPVSSGCQKRPAQFVLYSNPNLFLDSRQLNSTARITVASRVLSAGVGYKNSINLSQPLSMTFSSSVKVKINLSTWQNVLFLPISNDLLQGLSVQY